MTQQRNVLFNDKALDYCAQTIIDAIVELEQFEASERTSQRVGALIQKHFEVSPVDNDLTLSDEEIVAIGSLAGHLHASINLRLILPPRVSQI